MLRYCIIACAVLLLSREPSDLVLSIISHLFALTPSLVRLTESSLQRINDVPLMEKILEFIGHELRITISANFFWGTISNE